MFRDLKTDKTINNEFKNDFYSLFIFKFIVNLKQRIYKEELNKTQIIKYSYLIYLHNELLRILEKNFFGLRLQRLNLENYFTIENKYETRAIKKYQQTYIYPMSHNNYSITKKLDTIYKVHGVLIFIEYFANKKIEFSIFSKITYGKDKSKYVLVLLNNLFKNQIVIQDQMLRFCQKNNFTESILFIADFWSPDFTKEQILESFYQKNTNYSKFNFNILFGEDKNKNIFAAKCFDNVIPVTSFFHDKILCKEPPKTNDILEELVFYENVFLIKGQFKDNVRLYQNKFYLDENENNIKIKFKNIIFNDDLIFVHENRSLYLNIYKYDLYDSKLYLELNKLFFISNYKIICNKDEINNLKYLLKLSPTCDWKKFIKKNKIDITKNYSMYKVYRKYITTMRDYQELENIITNNGIEELLTKMLVHENLNVDEIFNNLEYVFENDFLIAKIDKNIRNYDLANMLMKFILKVKVLNV